MGVKQSNPVKLNIYELFIDFLIIGLSLIFYFIGRYGYLDWSEASSFWSQILGQLLIVCIEFCLGYYLGLCIFEHRRKKARYELFLNPTPALFGSLVLITIVFIVQGLGALLFTGSSSAVFLVVVLSLSLGFVSSQVVGFANEGQNMGEVLKDYKMHLRWLLPATLIITAFMAAFTSFVYSNGENGGNPERLIVDFTSALLALAIFKLSETKPGHIYFEQWAAKFVQTLQALGRVTSTVTIVLILLWEEIIFSNWNLPQVPLITHFLTLFLTGVIPLRIVSILRPKISVWNVTIEFCVLGFYVWLLSNKAGP